MRGLVRHVLKIAAYYLILHALFASAFRRPYEELFEARDELAVLYDGARKHADEMQRSFALIGRALSSSLRVDEALDRIAEIAAHKSQRELLEYHRGCGAPGNSRSRILENAPSAPTTRSYRSEEPSVSST